MDVTPRSLGEPVIPRAGGRGRTIRAIALLVVVVVALGFILLRGLGDATLFFLNVDEAVEQRADLGDRRFRIQGAVVADTVNARAQGVDFAIVFDGVEAEVSHTGAPPELFQEGIPVVLEGAWRGDRFVSDRILVKHDEVYVADNPGRTDYSDEDERPE